MKVMSCSLAMVACLGLTVRFGGTAVPAWFVGGMAGINKLLGRGNHNLALGMGGATIAANQLIGRGNHHLVLGLGYTFEAEGDLDVNAATATIGYRYARPRGTFFQVAATPFFTKHGAFPWAGVSIGQSF